MRDVTELPDVTQGMETRWRRRALVPCQRGAEWTWRGAMNARDVIRTGWDVTDSLDGSGCAAGRDRDAGGHAGDVRGELSERLGSVTTHRGLGM